MLASTGLFYFLVSGAIEYTFGRLIPTLVMVESPQALLFEPLDTIEPDAPINKNTEPELFLAKQKPITSSFRATIRHLQSKAGFRARFRGISLFVVYSFIFSSLSNSLSKFLPFGIAPVFTSLVLANLSLAWTHIVISDPSPKPWYRRLPETKVWKKIAGPTAILAAAEQLTIVVPIILARIYGFDRNMDPKSAANLSGKEGSMAALKGLSLVFICFALGLVLVVPANVMLTRVQASLLADAEESIVPFDRSFGGKVIPEIVGGSGVVGILEAWNTFDWNARMRLIKTYAKVFAMQLALMVVFIGIATAQLFIIIGKSDLKKIINDPNNGGEPTVTYSG